MTYIKPTFDDDFSEDIPTNIYYLVEQFLINCHTLSDYVEETDLISNQVLAIIYDANDDKIGRIRDIYNIRIGEIAEFVENNYDNDAYAKYLLNKAME